MKQLNSKPKTLLVDGEGLIKRSFSGAKDMYTPQFGHIGALYQFIVTLRQQIKLHNINKCVVFWDGNNSGKMRYNIYPKYKANRSSKDWYTKISLTEKEAIAEEKKRESILKQRVRVKQYLEELFIRQIEVDLIESDDLIAYYCKIYHTTENIIIYTNDRDMCQLLDYDNVNIYLANLKVLLNKESFFLEFEHHYKNASLMKVMCGDASDNIKGVKGLGETTLLNDFPEIKNTPLTYKDIIEKTKLLTEARANKKLGNKKVYEYILDGVNSDGEKIGDKLYTTNFEIINLLEPMMNKMAIHELKEVSELPIDDTDRGSKNLMEYMKKDGFLLFYFKDFIKFVEAFYGVILREKEFLKINK